MYIIIQQILYQNITLLKKKVKEKLLYINYE